MGGGPDAAELDAGGELTSGLMPGLKKKESSIRILAVTTAKKIYTSKHSSISFSLPSEHVHTELWLHILANITISHLLKHIQIIILFFNTKLRGHFFLSIP